MSCLVEGLCLMLTAFDEGQENQLSGDENGWPVESIRTVCVERLDLVKMYLRSCEIYANETVVADPQVATTRDDTRSDKKLDPIEIYWRSHAISEN